MKTAVNCPVCMNNCIQSTSEVPSNSFEWVELNDLDTYVFTCRNGHRVAVIRQSFKFENLFQLGALALIDGYTGEAISRFASSLERFFEFSINVMQMKSGISPEGIKDIWGYVKKSSERQVGVYLNTYLLTFKVLPSDYPERRKPDGQKMSWQEFRNQVTHNGYIPTTDEAMSYGELIYDYIQTKLQELESIAKDEIMKLNFQLQENATDEIKKRTEKSDELKWHIRFSA